jgi:hypothetical protein
MMEGIGPEDRIIDMGLILVGPTVGVDSLSILGFIVIILTGNRFSLLCVPVPSRATLK